MNAALSAVVTRLTRYLAKPVHAHNAAPPTSPERLLAVLRLAEVLLVEGHSPFSTAVKYLTQSTWSHAALYVGEHLCEAGGNAEHGFVEADVVEGVRSLHAGRLPCAVTAARSGPLVGDRQTAVTR